MVMSSNAGELDNDPPRLSKFSGGCHCGRIKVQLIARAGSGTISRVCSCGFCRKHAAIMLSVPDGLMVLESPARADTYRIGFGITEIHVCADCGVLVAATWSDHDKLLGAVNLNVVERGKFLGQPAAVDFDHETVNERQTRKRLT
jgi:hypothetical protein